MLQLPEHHGPVLHLVVQLQALDKILVGAGILGLLHLTVDREELGTYNQRFKILKTLDFGKNHRFTLYKS